MKIGYYCESPADRAALAALTEAILGLAPEPISMDLEAHSVPAFFSALDGVFRGVHYNSDAEGLVIVVDNDDSELHAAAHDAPGASVERCRFCKIRAIVERARAKLRPRQGQSELKVAIGVAVPAIEAWYLAGKNHEVGEAAWRVALNEGRQVFTRAQLKTLVYGTERPALEHETQCAITEALRIRQDLHMLETMFPDGFAPLAREVRSWGTAE